MRLGVSKQVKVSLIWSSPVSDSQQTILPLSELFESIYVRLKELSALHMRSQPRGHTLQPTAVVHEAFIKLAERDSSEFKTEEHFLATAATVLRSVLGDHARRRLAKKRGGQSFKASTDVFEPFDATVDSGGILALEDALQSLAKEDPRSAQVAELRIFGGLEPEHIARLLDLSSATVTRDWRFAKAWLQTDYDVRVRTGALRPSASNVIGTIDDSSAEVTQ